MEATEEEIKVSSWFLGPKAENADIFERLILEALRSCVFWRRNFHPEDEVLIKEKIRRDDIFQESIAILEEKLTALLGELNRSIPFHSPRYTGHMLGDQVLPALIGYFAAMLHNPNNVTPEASPIATEKEKAVAKQLAKLIGYQVEKSWGHITSGGSVANFEAFWVARNLKYFPIAARRFAEELDLNIEDLTNVDDWTLLNLDTDTILGLREKLIKEYLTKNPNLSKDKAEEKIDDELNIFTISGKGIHRFFAEVELDDPKIKSGIVIMSATAHYSLLKVTEALGIGKKQIIYIPVDEHFRMDISRLEEALNNCLTEKIPIIALVSIVASTEEGSVDLLQEIVKLQDVFKKKGLNFYHHCDAAYGGYIRSLFYNEKGEEVKIAGEIMRIAERWPPNIIFESFKHIHKADSVTIDPHKLGYIPYPAGAIIFNDKRVRDLISFEAPYIFHKKEEKGEKVSIGKYILEGSKPGAAAIACWLAHEVIPLNQSGYGLIIGKTLESAQDVCLRLEDLTPKLEGQGITLKVLNDRPDTNIICFIVNKKGNSELKKMNKLNEVIYEELKFDEEEPIQTHDFIITCTEFKYDLYKTCMGDHLKAVGISSEEYKEVGNIVVLRCSIMSPWAALSRGGKPDYIEQFALKLEERIKKAVEN